MKQKMMAMLVAFVMAISLAACGAGEETTLTGMVVSVDGSVISLMEMDTGNMGSQDFAQSQRPQMPGGFQDFGNFNPEDFTMPEGGNMPQWGGGEMPEDFTMPENFAMPEGMTIPEGMEGMMPGIGGMPNFGGNGGMPSFGGNGDMRPDSGITDVETKTVDIANAHISIEIENGKEGGSMSDIKAGTFVTITINGKGEATYVLITSQYSFSGGRRPAN